MSLLLILFDETHAAAAATRDPPPPPTPHPPGFQLVAGAVLLTVLFVCRHLVSGVSKLLGVLRPFNHHHYLRAFCQWGLLFYSPFSSSVASLSAGASVLLAVLFVASLSAGTSIHCSFNLSPVYLPGPVFANVRSFDLGRTPHQKCFSCFGGSCCFSLGSNSLQDGRLSAALRPAHSTACCAGQTVMLTYRDCAGQTVMLTYRDCAGQTVMLTYRDCSGQTVMLTYRDCAGQTVMLTYRDCAGQTVMLTYRDCAGQTVMLTYRDCAGQTVMLTHRDCAEQTQ